MGRMLRCLVWVFALTVACGDDDDDGENARAKDGAGGKTALAAGSGGAAVVAGVQASSGSGGRSVSSAGGVGGTAAGEGGASAALAGAGSADDRDAGEPNTGAIGPEQLRDNVELNCTETQRCAMIDGVEDCVDVTLSFLTVAPADIQQGFQRLVAACRHLESCEYVTCSNDFTAGGL